MLIGFDHVISYGIVLLALAYCLRPTLYRMIGRNSAGAKACHSNTHAGCQGGCTACPLARKASLG